MKKITCLLLILIIFVSAPFNTKMSYVYADSTTTSSEQIQSDLLDSIEEQLGSLDMSELDEILSSIDGQDYLFNGKSFVEKVKMLISGDMSINASSFLNYVLNLAIDNVLSFLPYVCLLIAIAVLYSMVNNVQSGKNKNISDIIHFVCYGAIVVIVIVWVSKLLNITSAALGSVKRQMELVFPILLTVLTALGSGVSVGVYQPAMAILSSTALSVFTDILLPIFSFMMVFIIISNLTTNIKFNKFADFFSSSFKWILGLVLTVFSAFVSLHGLMAGSIDTLSLKTAKYTIKSAVPLIGGFLSDGISLIMISCVLVKNAIGVSGLLLLFATILMPIVQIIVFSFLMKLASAILEPIADARVSSFVSSVGKGIQMLIALMLGVAFMYFIMVSLVMCSTNIF